METSVVAGTDGRDATIITLIHLIHVRFKIMLKKCRFALLSSIYLVLLILSATSRVESSITVRYAYIGRASVFISFENIVRSIRHFGLIHSEKCWTWKVRESQGLC
jgi:hypothetical protein